jgi:cytochrome P450 family 13
MAYMAFGGGRRICVGLRLALLELKLTLAQIGRRYTMHVCDKTEVRKYGK